MQRKTLLLTIAVAIATLFLATTGWAQPAPGPYPLGANPPVNQNLGYLDMLWADQANQNWDTCLICHPGFGGGDRSLADRHHLKYGQDIPPLTSVPFPDASDGIYVCLSCHAQSGDLGDGIGDGDVNFVVERDCYACHENGHHQTLLAKDLNCKACHGDFVDNPYDGHYVPTYDPSLVTPYRGLNGDGYENKPYPTKDLESDGSGLVFPLDFTTTEAGPPFFTVTDIGPLGTLNTRNEPNRLKFKPAGDNNDVFIGSTQHGGEEYSVVFNSGGPSATWDADTQTLTVSVPAIGGATAEDLVNLINAATGEVDVEATLGYDGEDAVADLLPPEHYEPIGGDPPNNRNFGAGSCSYCHDNDGNLDANGDPEGPIWDNHTLHHEIGLPFMVSDGEGGYTLSRCDLCHGDRSVAGEQSGPNFDEAIRFCERCHGPDSLHNIQGDSPNDPPGIVVVGGEDAGYGHVGRDAGPGDSDCWGCHGFATAASSLPPNTGPIVPTIYMADRTVVKGGKDTTVVLDGASFTNTSGGTVYESKVALTAGDGSSVILTPDSVEEGTLTVTIPGNTVAGNYRLQAVKDDVASNTTVISVVPEVVITKATSTRRGVVITGRGFSGYAAGSGTAVTATVATGQGRSRSIATTEGKILSWTDTKIVASFDTVPSVVTVKSVFGTKSFAIRTTTSRPTRR